MEKKKKKDIPKKKEEVCEIFEVEKDGKKEIVKACGTEEEKPVTPEQIKKENKTFRNILIIMAGFGLLFVLFYTAMYFSTHFIYKDIEFERIKQGDLMLYRTSLPVFYQGQQANYNFYLRKDPRILDLLEFNGKIRVKEDMVINMTQDFDCDGDGIIAIANILNVYNVLGTEVIKDENASCDDLYGKYMWVNLMPGDETKIVEYGLSGACYNIYIKDCEILEGTEKFIVETLSKVNNDIKQ